MNIVRCFPIAPAIALLALLPGSSHADLPSASNSSLPAVVWLVGLDERGNADLVGTMTFVIRTFTNEPLGQAMVTLGFDQATDLLPSMSQPDPGIHDVLCSGGHRFVRAITDGNGVATIRIVGSALRSAPGTYAPSLLVVANGVPIGRLPVSAFDQDGSNGVTPPDLSLVLDDMFSGQSWERSDFDGSGTIGPNDLSLWLQAYYGNSSVSSASRSPGCP